MLARLLGELGGEDHGVVSDGPAYGYRNKIELTFGTGRYLLSHELNTEIKREGRWLGFHAPGRYDRIVDTPDCALASPAINAVYARIRADVLASEFGFWDCNAHTGFFRNLILREGSSREVLAAMAASQFTPKQVRRARERQCVLIERAGNGSGIGYAFGGFNHHDQGHSFVAGLGVCWPAISAVAGGPCAERAAALP